MKFSEQWLRTWVNPDATTEELVSKITMAGLEVDEYTLVAPAFSGVVVGEIVACEQHPDADKLRVTKVSHGTEEFQVVCGAPNARVGIKIPFAMVGAVLPGNFKIKKAKLRGVESLGMLCGADEIGLAEERADGLLELPVDAPVGEDIRTYLNLNDTIIDVDLTPNRGDCLSIAGLAREVSANFLADVTVPAIEDVIATIDDTFEVNLEAPEQCPRFVGRVLRNVNVKAETPVWMVERLRRSGIRSIDPVVDVTNYVMIELGTPMHGYDLDRLEGCINVRLAEQGEKLLMLDGTEQTLNSNTLVIADEKKVLGIAGVMGGEHSGVNADATSIFLECAFFDKIAIAGKARAYGLHTDASHRFERGVDYQMQTKAIERATGLILEICGGEAGPVVEVAVEENLPKAKTVILNRSKVASLLGVDLPADQIAPLLTCLGMELTATSEDQWSVAVPSWRFDISIEEDLVEEVGRIYGYNNLPNTMPLAELRLQIIDEAKIDLSELRRVLVARGYREAINFSFIDPKLHTLFDPEREAEPLANPISSEMSVMRTSLMPGMVSTLRHNLNRQQNRIRIFESGQIFIRNARGTESSLTQDLWMGGAICGSRDPESWHGAGSSVDFFDLKGDVEALFARVGNAAEYSFRAAQRPALHPGQCAEILRNGEVVGVIGALHPKVAKACDINVPVYLFEISADVLVDGSVTSFRELSKYPEVRRDMALVLDQATPEADVEAVIREQAGEWLRSIRLFDVYSGKGVEEGKKSLALGVTWRHAERTLTDEEINASFAAITSALADKLGAALRQ
ncbi:phenylalanine--tRNA ligase subunit beta [Parendozoicomonas haliclonae]|uniref:Phenylalanine--tRNA ligase beta subunit n=1 Tax=Parendozoicomonas haliclonae TaxID=1960125 RepID=A0A1X7AHV1_9GAMM|nr:phenylalanine--tRNA ligase subunit beta [Parendozoicomonas haliclonae]SMA41766.1 Phenylalanine-tRNA ligase beta subunit [Parendozoicomonas haliclonae]